MTKALRIVHWYARVGAEMAITWMIGYAIFAHLMGFWRVIYN